MSQETKHSSSFGLWLPAMASAAAAVARMVNEAVSLLVFIVLDLLDALLCFVYKMADYVMEECKPCYCSSSFNSSDDDDDDVILVAEKGGSKLLSLTSSASSDDTKLHLEDISDTLFLRPCLLADLAQAALHDLCKLKLVSSVASSSSSSAASSSSATTTFTTNSAIVRVLRGKVGRARGKAATRGASSRSWTDCACESCNHWSSPSGERDALFVHVEGPKGEKVAEEDVVFIHGFLSSSAFWTETVFPNVSEAAKSRYRLLAVDLLGFGRSPKPPESLYTLREHVEMIERSVLRRFQVKSFHIVAHSLGSILALALAVKYPGAVKSLTLLAPPYFPVPKGEHGTHYVLRRVAPRRVWPLMAFGASVLCWYEHISRVASLVLCKNHRRWESAFKFVTRNRIRTYLMDGFFCHTHNASWHTFHNIICGAGAGKVEAYLEAVAERLSCDVVVFHGRDDELLPVDCSYAVKSKVPRTRVVVVDRKDHLTIVVGRQKAFAGELVDIWENANKCCKETEKI
ncbi:probable lysophospholipase BODYGUARD 1 [Zingiber officinale]|uniref:probable lysophospholipase BODYGUARD 1 n=1 Tax=Zingiber officinale TaxID=94328 RepID=UPI001C4CEC60|nr:probable lysophospholipase BODYGUARD 1 [Zingiber officinale]